MKTHIWSMLFILPLLMSSIMLTHAQIGRNDVTGNTTNENFPADFVAIPRPENVQFGSGTLSISAANRVVYSSSALQKLAEVHTADIALVHEVDLASPRQGTNPGQGDIYLKLASNLSGEDSRITIDGSKVVIEAADYEGLAFAMMTALQSYKADGSSMTIRRMTISDSPDIAYRAYQVTIKVNGNVSKNNYYGLDNLKKHIDLARMYKVRYIQFHTTESQWMLATLPESNNLSDDLLQSKNLYSKAQWDELIRYAADRGVFLQPHNESTPTFRGMKVALTDFSDTGFNWIEAIYAQFGQSVTGGLDGRIGQSNDGVDASDPDYDKAMELFTRASYQQFAAGYPDGNVPFYHMGPVYGEGGTSPAEMAKIISYLRKEDGDVKVMFWGGVNVNDPIAQQYKRDIVIALYSPNDYHPLMDVHIDAGYQVINAAWRPHYITPGSYSISPELFYQNSNPFREGNDGIARPLEYYDHQPSDQMLGSMISQWDFSTLGQDQLGLARPRIAPWADRTWNYKPISQYQDSDWASMEDKFAQVDVMTSLLFGDGRPPGSIAPDQAIDLADIVGGGNGSLPGTARQATVLGASRTTFTSADTPLIDGTFVPLNSGDTTISTTGLRTNLTGINSFESPGGNITNGYPYDESVSENVFGSLQMPNLDDTENHSALYMHASQGVTFDLNAIEAATGEDVDRFTAVALSPTSASTSYAIILDGTEVASGALLGQAAEQIDIEIAPNARFLTLVTGDNRDGTINNKHAIFINPYLQKSTGAPTPPPAPNGSFTLINAKSNKCVEVAGGATSNGSNIQQYACNGSTAQLWREIPSSNGDFSLQNVKSNKCMDVEGNSAANGANVLLWDCSASPNQTFKWQNGALRFGHSGECLDVFAGRTGDGVNIQHHACNGTPAQSFSKNNVAGGTSQPTFTHPTNSYDGTSGDTISHRSALNVAANNSDFSVEFCVRPEQSPTGQWRAVMHKGNSNSERTFAIWLRPHDMRLHYRISTTDNWNSGGNTSAALSLNQPTKVSYIRDGDQLKMYMNGVLDSQTTLRGTVLSNTGSLHIGDSPWYGGTKGQIGGFAVYDTAITPTAAGCDL